MKAWEVNGLGERGGGDQAKDSPQEGTDNGIIMKKTPEEEVGEKSSTTQH